MARVYFNQTWFESVRSESWNEADYEQVVMNNAGILFPQWIAVPFKTNVVGDDGTIKQPDIALIDRSYRRWCVVEVELASHHFVNHVAPQVEAFRTAKYDNEHAEYLHRKQPSLDLARLKAMVAGEPPQIVVVVDRPDTDWKRRLKHMDIALTIVEPFRGPGTHTLLRINGEAPDLPGNVLTRLSRTQLRRLWKVHSPAALPPSGEDNTLDVFVESAPTRWKVTRLATGVLVTPLWVGDILRGWKGVDLVRHDDGSLSIQPVVLE